MLKVVLFVLGFLMVAVFGGLHLYYEFVSRMIADPNPVANFGLFALWVIGTLGLLATLWPPVDRKQAKIYGAVFIFLSCVWLIRALQEQLPQRQWEVLLLIAMTVGPVGTGLIFMRVAFLNVRGELAKSSRL